MTHIMPPEIWDNMTDQEKEDFNKNPISDPARGIHELMPQHKPDWFKVPITKPMTDRDRLAEKLYVYYAYHNASDEELIEFSTFAIKSAGIFFNALENNNEDE